MRIFRQDYNKPGPGVPIDAPRKKGLARFFEVLLRNFWDLVKLNLIYSLLYLPSQVLLFLTALSFGNALSLLFGALTLAAFIPVGPARAALSFCISKMLRDDPGFVGYEFFKSFKSAFRLTAIPGMAHELVVAVQLYFVLTFFSGAIGESVPAALFLLSLLIVNMIAPYFYLQAGYLDLKTGPLLKNSVLLAFGNAPRSIGGAMLGGVLVFVMSVASIVANFVLLPLTALIGFSFPALFCLSFIWKPVDDVFSIEATIRGRVSGSLETYLSANKDNEPPE